MNKVYENFLKTEMKDLSIIRTNAVKRISTYWEDMMLIPKTKGSIVKIDCWDINGSVDILAGEVIISSKLEVSAKAFYPELGWRVADVVNYIENLL